MPYLSGITIYPVKSLDGIGLQEVSVLPCGALLNDRRWRLVDIEGDVVNAKKNVRFHAIRSTFHLEGAFSDSIKNLPHGQNMVTLSVDERFAAENLQGHCQETFPLLPGRDGPCEWLSGVLAEKVFLQERIDGGFPDDRDATGPTIISTESLVEVASWFGLTLNEARRRFRMNLELSSDENEKGMASQESIPTSTLPFWEDALACPAAIDALENPESEYLADVAPVSPKSFWLGLVGICAKGICRRCVVPSRDSLTGVVFEDFQASFEARRSHLLPVNVNARNWRDYFCLGLNTSIETISENKLKIGDQLCVGPPKSDA